jgi:tRNA(Ile2) C34 agmatinyltransferase TiaS
MLNPSHVCEQCGATYYAKGLCRRCYYAKRRQDNPEYVRAINRKSRAMHREKARAQAQAWYAEHREEHIARSTAYNATHRKEINARKRARYWAKKQTQPPSD